MAKKTTLDIETEIFDVNSFCIAHMISRAHFYNLLKVGLGPETMKLGRRRFISKDAATRWHRKMEQKTAEEDKEEG